MILKPKTARRLLLLGAVLVVAIASAVGFFVVRKWQLERRFQTYRAVGMEAAERGEHAQVMDNLGRYLRNKKHENDREALVTYARAREKVQEKDFSNLRDAAGIFERALSLDPDDDETRLKLVELYNLMGLSQEALGHADRLLPDNLSDATAEHVEPLRGRITALIGLRPVRANSPLGVARDLTDPNDRKLTESIDTLVSLQPDDFGAHFLKVSWLRERDSVAAAREYAQKVASRRPDDPAFQIMVELSQLETEEGAQPIIDRICQIIGLDRGTARFTREPSVGSEEVATRLVGLFDGLRMYRHSLAVAKAALDAENDLQLRRVVARRAWQGGRPDLVLEVTDGLDPAAADAELLAFRALTHLQQNNTAQAAAISDALAARAGSDYLSRSWSPLLKGLSGSPAATGRDLVIAADDSLKENGREPIFHFFRGEALAQLDRLAEAREAWEAAASSPLAIGWVPPMIRITDSLLSERRWEEANRSAEAAIIAAPDNVAANINLVIAQASLLENGFTLPESPATILARVESALAATRSDTDAARNMLEQSLLPARVVLASRAKDPDRARDFIRAYLQSGGEKSQSLLERLARLSISEGLGMDEQILAAANTGEGRRPSAELVRALAMVRDGKTDEAKALLEAGRSASAPAQKLEWSVVIAQFKDAMQDPTATAEWIAIGDANPANLDLQSVILQSDSALRDAAFTQRTIDRFIELSGADPGRPPISIRIARARSLLAQDVTARARDEAVGILRALVAEVPSNAQARNLLATALMIDQPAKNIRPDLAGAVEQLRAVANLVPDPMPVRLQLAAILARRGDTAGARDEFLRIAADPAIDASYRATAAVGLFDLREFAAAIPPLENLTRSLGDNASNLLLLRLAQAYEMAGRQPDSRSVIQTLAQRELTEPEVIFSVADNLAFAGNTDEAARILDRLDQTSLTATEKLTLRAEFAQRRGREDQAADLYRQIIAAAPDSPAAYVALAQLELNRGERDAATAVLAGAPQSVREDPRTRVLEQQIKVSGSPDGEVDFAALAAALEGSEEFRSRAEAVRALDELRQRGALRDPEALLDLARRFRDERTVQLIVSNLLLGLDPPAVTQAATLASEAVARFPGDLTIAEMATRSFAGAQDWNAMLSSAQVWAQLSRDVAADLAVAEAHLGANRPNQAAAVLRPLTASAAAQLDQPVSVGIILTYARALLNQRDERGAADFLAPLMTSNPAIRRDVWLSLAAGSVPTVEAAKSWIDRARAAGDGRIEDARAVALAYIELGGRFPAQAASLAADARAVIAPFATADADPGTIQLLAAANEQAGDTAAAIAGYRKVLASNPATMPALARLTQLLSSSPATAEEAVSVAQTAYDSVSAENRGVAMSLILARAHHNAGMVVEGPAGQQHLRQAIEHYETCSTAAPRDVQIQAQAANAAEALGDFATATRFYKRLLANPPADPQFLAVMQNNAAYAAFRSGASGTQLTEARDLARAAAGVLPEAPVLDTLGHLEAATGDRAAAATAFRQAIAKQPDLASARIGLAAALAPGSPQEQSEARSLIAGIDAAKLADHERQELDAVRSALGG